MWRGIIKDVKRKHRHKYSRNNLRINGSQFERKKGNNALDRRHQEHRWKLHHKQWNSTSEENFREDNGNESNPNVIQMEEERGQGSGYINKV